MGFVGVSQSSDCDNTVGSQLTVGSSCLPITWNLSNNTDYWNSASGCAAGDYDDAWGWFIATSTTTTITYTPTTDDAILTLFSVACSSTMSSVACSDNGGSGGVETITYSTTIGTTYHVRIQRYLSNDNMNGTICVWSPSSTPCSSPTIITCGTSATYNNSGTGVWYTSSSNPCGYYSEGVEKIYSYTPSTTGVSNLVVTSTSGGYIDYLYQASTCSSTGWTCIDDNYEFIDDEPFDGISYYRLKQTDFDGNFEYFPPKSIQILGDKIFNLYPVPAKNCEDVRLYFKNFDDEVLVVVNDIYGREIYTKIIITHQNGFVVGLDCTNTLTSGTYIIIATSKNEIYKKKLIIN